MRKVVVATWVALGWLWFMHEVSLHFKISFFKAYVCLIPLLLANGAWCFWEASRLRGNRLHSWRELR